MAAEGWRELGNMIEAWIEFNQIRDSLKSHPDALEIKWLLEAEDDYWERALETARQLIKTSPNRPSGWIHQSYALRRIGENMVSEARRAILPAVAMFPKEPVIPYNLACYACILGDHVEAMEWLLTAMKRGDRKTVKQMALNDSDLETMWSKISKI